MRINLRKTLIAALILAMGTTPMAKTYITAQAMSAGYVNSGPGVGLGGSGAGQGATREDGYPIDSGISLDAAAYASSGGVAIGELALVIDDTVPEGCVQSVHMEVEDPIVKYVDTYTYDYMVNDIKALSAKYPGRLKQRSLAKTPDGRDIYELIVGNERAATHIMINASTHAREYITSNLVMLQLEYLLYFYDEGCFDGKPLKQWFNDVCVHFVPMVNPDGVSISQFGLEGLRSQSLRGTVQKAYEYDVAGGYTSLDFDTYLRSWKANARGVNLNQNFDAMFEFASGKSQLPSAEDYRGPYVESEPESKALADLYDSRTWRAVINYHAQGQVLYWDIENNKMREHSRDLSNNIMLITGYQKAVAGGGGGFKEYVQLCSRPAACVTIEVGSGTCPLPGSQLPTIWAQNKFVPLYTMKWAYDIFVVRGDR